MAGLALLGLTMPASGQAEQVHKLERNGLKLELAALAPDQVRAFFLARGFPAAETEHIAATACLFRSAIGSAFRKPDDPEVRSALAEWRVVPAGQSARPPRTREDWETVWRQRGVGEEPATAFYWSLFPTEQTFASTDYNWGFLTFGLPPGTRFAVELRWSSAGKNYNAQLEGLECGK